MICGETHEALILLLHLRVGVVLAALAEYAHDHRIDERHPRHACTERASQVKPDQRAERVRHEMERAAEPHGIDGPVAGVGLETQQSGQVRHLLRDRVGAGRGRRRAVAEHVGREDARSWRDECARDRVP